MSVTMQSPMPLDQKAQLALADLESMELICLDGDHYRTTRRWQAAMARAIQRLDQNVLDEENVDVRVPITSALLELHHDDISDTRLVSEIAAMVWVESSILERLIGARIKFH